MKTFKEFLEQESGGRAKHPNASSTEIKEKHKELTEMSLLALEGVWRKIDTGISKSELYGGESDKENKKEILVDNIMVQLYGDEWQKALRQ